jgi:hypothetical protein
MPDIERVNQYSSLTDRVRPADHRDQKRQKHGGSEHDKSDQPEDVLELHDEPEQAEPPQQNSQELAEEHLDLSA